MSKTLEIARLNDAFRQSIYGVSALGRFLITSGIQNLHEADRAAILEKVRSFDAFTPDNDPYGEHDFGSFEHAGKRIFWKIDYYAEDMMHGSEDPSDPARTFRVLTIMLADEY